MPRDAPGTAERASDGFNSTPLTGRNGKMIDMGEDSQIKIGVKADTAQAENALSEVQKKVDGLNKSISAHVQSDKMMNLLRSGGSLALAGSSMLSPLVEIGFGENVAKTLQTTVSSAVSLSAALAPIGPVGAAAGLAIGGFGGVMSSFIASMKKAEESSKRAAEAIKSAAEAEERRALSVAVDRRMTHQEVSDLWWSDPEGARKMLERKREPLKRMQAIAAEGGVANLEEIQVLAPYLRREELTGLLGSMKGNKGWTDQHAAFYDIFEFAETAKLAASPETKKSRPGQMLNLNPGQYDALKSVETRWENEEQSISETLGIYDYQTRQRAVYGKARKYAEEYARKADSAHGQMENLELFLSTAFDKPQSSQQRFSANTEKNDILSRLLPSAPQTDALGSVGKGIGGHSVTEELSANLKKLVDIAERQLSEAKWSRGTSILS